jgi:transcriptional antiterminator RfaH
MPFSSGFVSFDEEPASVPDNMVQAIRRHVDAINAAGGIDGSSLKPGETVVVQGGLFDGYEAILDAHIKGTERVRVLLKLLQTRQMSLELPAEQVRPKRDKKR